AARPARSVGRTPPVQPPTFPPSRYPSPARRARLVPAPLAPRLVEHEIHAVVAHVPAPPARHALTSESSPSPVATATMARSQSRSCAVPAAPRGFVTNATGTPSES